MTSRFRLNPLLQAACVVSMTLVPALYLAARPGVSAQAAPADAAAHKQMMNDASDAQEDFRFAVTDKDQKAAVAALTKLEVFMGQTEVYWTAKKAADGVTLAKEARALAAQALAAAKTNDLKTAQGPFEKMGTTCNACHELHLEKR